VYQGHAKDGMRSDSLIELHSGSGSPGRSSRDTVRSARSGPSPIASASTPPPKNNQALRNGSIIKGYRRGLQTTPRNEATNASHRRSASWGLPRWYFIVNGTKLRQWQDVFPLIVRELQSSVNMRVLVTKYAGHGRKLARKAAGSGADLIAAVGGDGTLNEVVDGVMRAGVIGDDGLPHPVISVLPLGTGCDFLRSMSWNPQDFAKAVKMMLKDITVVLDVGRVRCLGPSMVGTSSASSEVIDRYFINVASSGASAQAAQKVHHWRWTKGLTYRMAGFEGLLRQKPQTLALRIDGGEWQRLTSVKLVAVGNGSHFGGGYNITPGANPFDGRLNVVIGSSIGVFDFLVNSNRLKKGTHVNMNKFTSYEATTLDIGFWDSIEQKIKVDDITTALFGLGQPVPLTEASLREPSITWSESESGRSDVTGRSRGNGSPGKFHTVSSKNTSSSSSKNKLHYGAMPLEVDGEVIGQAPFSINIIPSAIKFRISLGKGKR
jgi:YegS/Rv2252/BmrU family lipid kinase